MDAAELAAFRQTAGSDVALRVRKYDDGAKVAGQVVPGVEAYRQMVEEHLRERSTLRLALSDVRA